MPPLQSSFVRKFAFILALLLLGILGNPQVLAGEEEQEESLSPQLEELGNALKAAVISGNMDEEQAWEIWNTAVEDAKGGDDDQRMWQDRQSDKTYDDTNARQRMARLLPPDPLEPAMLMEPEFLPRDVQLLSNWLELDEQRVLVIETIIRDYGDSMEQLTAGMRPALKNYRRSEDAREVQQMLAQLEDELLSRQIDMDASTAIIEEKVRGYARERIAKDSARDGISKEDLSNEVDARTAEWTAELSRGLENMDEQLRLLRDRMRSRVDAVSMPEGEITSRDLVSLAESIRDQRARLRQDVIEMLELMLVIEDDAEAEQKLESALARLRIEHGFRHARMGGEFINPWSLVSELEQQPENQNMADEILSSQQVMLAEMVQDRTDASIEREVEGLRLLIARDDLVAVAGDEDNVPIETWYEVIEPFTDAWHRQIDSSVAYRDSILQLIELTRQMIAQDDPATADLYYDRSMRRGFGSELRTRWSERAITVAIALEDLDQETMLVILALQEETLDRLRLIRDEAIEKRLLRDPELARQPILSLWSLDDSREKPWIRSDWTGHGMEAHQDLNKHVESSLKALLTPEQFELIPTRGGRSKDGKSVDRKENGKGQKGKGQNGKGQNGKGQKGQKGQSNDKAA